MTPKNSQRSMYELALFLQHLRFDCSYRQAIIEKF
jgi:hypothetical protein